MWWRSSGCGSGIRRAKLRPRVDDEQQRATDVRQWRLGDHIDRPVAIHGAGGKVRPVWDNPILWREVRTWAYGKEILVIRLAYWAVFAACAAALVATASPIGNIPPDIAIPAAAKPLVTLLVVGLILLNALAVTSLTNERDSRALDLLLVTDLSPKEIVFGKLGGAFYNAKEMILLPIALCVYLWFAERLDDGELRVPAGRAGR